MRQILFQIGKNFYGDFSDVATGLRRGLFEPYATSRVVPAFQIGQNLHRRRPQIWTAPYIISVARIRKGLNDDRIGAGYKHAETVINVSSSYEGKCVLLDDLTTLLILQLLFNLHTHKHECTITKDMLLGFQEFVEFVI